MDITLDRLTQARGSTVYAEDGDKIGKIEEIFTDVDTREPEWIGIGTGFLRTKRVLVPVAGAQLSDDGVRVPYAKDTVAGSPDIDDDEISPALERELYEYYGVPYSRSESDTQLPAGDPTGDVDATQQASTTRSEEELVVGKESVPAGTVRLKKWVETEPVETDVTLRRETAKVQRERIDQPVDDAEFQEKEIEVPLEAERAVVGKRTVAKERVSIGKDVEEVQEPVRDEVRKERVGLEADEEDIRRAG